MEAAQGRLATSAVLACPNMTGECDLQAQQALGSKYNHDLSPASCYACDPNTRGVNCIHGVQTTCGTNDAGEPMCPTSFPNPNALGASFNESAWKEMGHIIGVELRSLWLHGATEASSWSGKPHAGLDCWSPNVNINRDPRWVSRANALKASALSVCLTELSPVLTRQITN